MNSGFKSTPLRKLKPVSHYRFTAAEAAESHNLPIELTPGRDLIFNMPCKKIQNVNRDSEILIITNMEIETKIDK